MGLSTGIAVHARNRDEPDRQHDLRQAPKHLSRSRWGSLAGVLIVWAWPAVAGETLRIATFHTELDRDGPGLLLSDVLDRSGDVLAAAELIVSARADVLVLQGIDYDHGLVALAAFSDLVEEMGEAYPHRFAWRPNSGRATGLDLDGDGRVGGPRDAAGYGEFAGQGAVAILSRLPIDEAASHDLSPEPWAGLPGTLFVAGDGPETQPLSSAAHWDLRLMMPSGTDFRLWTYHATPPVFDGPEDRNGRRNHDETALWLLRIEETRGPFVVVGDANIDPQRGEGRPQAIRSLLGHPRIRDTDPLNRPTVDWPDPPDGPGDLRVSYVLPSTEWRVTGAGQIRSEVSPDDGGPRHALVWADLVLDR